MRLQILLLLLWCTGVLSAQELSQTIRGTIQDNDNLLALSGATIIIQGSDPLIGTSSDVDGNFRLENIPVGRKTLIVSFLGYNPATFRDLNLKSGKEIILNVLMNEKVTEINELLIRAWEKTDALNAMTTVSTRQFTVEESQRFAGARNDVARMAANYAGVSTANDATNEIVIRGNSPNGLLWRLEGVEIANPNHYGALSSSGGTVSMLNNNVLSNSDFLTGAFPASFGNALSGAFDLQMRRGNNEQFEFLGQVGFNGFEGGIEGPLGKNKKSSFLINYRYSTMGLLGDMGLDFGTGTAIPFYQDLSWKFYVPTKKLGNFTFWGIGGKSDIEFINSGKPEDDDGSFYGTAGLDVYNYNQSISSGISQQLRINDRSRYKLTLSVNAAQNLSVVDSVHRISREASPFVDEDYTLLNYIAVIDFNTKINRRFHLNYGMEARVSDYNLKLQRYFADDDGFEIGSSGQTNLYRAFMQGKYSFNEAFSLHAGLHSQLQTLNNSYALDPRMALRYEVSARHSFQFAYGLHSQTQPLYIYFIKGNSGEASNTNLDFTRSHHYVFSYDWNINKKRRFKTELYYQSLFDAPIENGVSSSFSLLNNNRFNFVFPEKLINDGTGTNLGIDLTFEQFLNNGFYYLLTSSFYDSKYKGSDGVERSTAFDGGYTFSMLGGYEWALPNRKKKQKQHWIDIDAKLAMAGGQRYTPIDFVESNIQNKAVYDQKHAFELQFKDYVRLDVRVAYRLDTKNVSQEFVFDIQNVTNRSNPLYTTYDATKGVEQLVNQLGFMPMMQYRITF